MKAAFAGASVGLAVVVASLFVAAASCGSDDTTTPPGVKPDTAGTDTPVDTTINPDSPPTDGPTPDGDGGPCPTTPTDGKLAELLDPTSAKVVTKNKGMRLTGVIVTSQKFQVSKSSKAGGTCLYGIFVADANATFLPYSGILVVSKGNPATAGETGGTFCTKGDMIPDTVAVGDKLNLTGTFDPFGPTATTCGAATPPLTPPTPALINEMDLCAYEKTGTGTVPTPADVAPTDLDDKAAALGKWQAGLVRITNVTAKSSTKPGDSSFGAFTINEATTLRITDTIYYRGASTAPTVNIGDKFTSVVGQVYLDFCTWSLAARTICDLTPIPGDGSKCGGTGSDAGTDATTD